MKSKKSPFLYPEKSLLPLFYQYIYKYESLGIKSLRDKQIKDVIAKDLLQNFEVALNAIQKTGKSLPPHNNKEIISLFNEYQKGKQPKDEFFFEKRITKATSWNSILYHLRNSLAHAEFNEVGGYYKIFDYDGKRLTAFGFINRSVLLQLLNAFVEE